MRSALLHDSLEFVPLDVDLDELLTVRLGTAVTRVVCALEAEHIGLDTTPGGPPIPVNDPWVLHASAADKIVAVSSMGFHRIAAPHLPATMAADLDLIVTRVEQTTAEFRYRPSVAR